MSDSHILNNLQEYINKRKKNKKGWRKQVQAALDKQNAGLPDEEKKVFIEKLVIKGNIHKTELLDLLGFDYKEQIKKKQEELEASNQIAKEEGLEFRGFDWEKEKLKLNQEEEEITIEEGQDYVYNKKLDKYVINLKSAGKPFVISGEDHRSIITNYSNWLSKGSSINEICRKFSIPRACFNEYKRIFGLTHDIEPLSKEEVLEGTTDGLVDNLLERKRFAIHQKYERESWKKTQDNATNWEHFTAKILDPFEKFLQNWQPKATPLALTVPLVPKGDLTFVCGCFDWHIGAFADGSKINFGEGWNSQKAKDLVAKYVSTITSDVMGYNYKFKKAVVLLGGDLMHGLRGRTEKGTVLSCDIMKEDQFDALFDTLTNFLEMMAAIFPEVEVHTVRGNHEGFDFYPIGRALAAYYRNEPRVDIYIYKTKNAIFRINNVLVVLEHGASDTIKASVPTADKAREAYVQHYLLENPQLLIGAKSKIMVVGDKHSFEQKCYNDFEFFRFGALPTGDEYAEAIGYKPHSRQNCLVLDDDKVKTVHHYYLDK